MLFEYHYSNLTQHNLYILFILILFQWLWLMWVST